MDDGSIKIYSSEYEKSELSEDFLEHHGILGMRWGKRNGPPYPLDSDVSTGKKLKKEGRAEKQKAKKTYKNRVKSLKKARATKAANQVKKQEQKKSKEDIVKTKDIESMLKNVDLFTNKEINDMLDRLSTESKLKEAVAKQREANKSTGQRIKDNISSNVKTGLKSGAEKTVRLVAKNLVGISMKTLANAAAKVPEEGTPEERRAKFIKELFKEEKK